MKKILLVICFFAFLTSCSNTKNDLKKQKLHGKVRSIVEVQYNAIERFGEIVEGNIDNIGNSSMVFNERGNLINKCWLSTCSDYEFDEKGNLIILDFGPKNKIEGKWEFNHDSNGNEIEGNHYDNNFSLITKKKYVNDGNGNLIRERSYNAYGSLTDITEYKYDIKGNQRERLCLNTAGEILNKDEFKFDDDDNLIEAKTSISNAFFLFSYQFKYDFDKNNNWIKQICSENGKPKYIIKREIKYWN